MRRACNAENEHGRTASKIVSWRLFSRREEIVGAIDIIKWWEVRRIPYNIAVGTTGVFTIVAILVIAGIASEKFGEPLGLPDPPILAWIAVIGYAIGANVCYTGGWLVEIMVGRIWRERAGAFAEIAFVLGTVFSILLTLTPSAICAVLFMMRLLFW